MKKIVLDVKAKYGKEVKVLKAYRIAVYDTVYYTPEKNVYALRMIRRIKNEIRRWLLHLEASASVRIKTVVLFVDVCNSFLSIEVLGHKSESTYLCVAFFCIYMNVLVRY